MTELKTCEHCKFGDYAQGWFMCKLSTPRPVSTADEACDEYVDYSEVFKENN